MTAINEQVKALVESESRMKWEDILKRHPIQAESIERTVGNPIELVMKKLDEDADYQDLIRRTDDEAGLAGFAKVLGPILERVVTGLLVG